jgi:hypothetical protein
MKKTALILALFFMCGCLLGADAVAQPVPGTKTAKPAEEETIISYDVYKHMENSSDIFLGIAGLSLGMGAGLIANAGNNPTTLGIGVENLTWGLVEACFFLYDRNFVDKISDEKKAREEYVKMSGWHAIFDLGYIAAGGCIALFGDKYLKGHGLGIVVQGMMLSVYDGINFFIASNPEDVKDWGAGVKYNIQIANK